MIRRAGAMRADDTLFVKTVKARQNFRFDVPCFGMKTLKTMDGAGIRAAALEAGGVILLDKAAVLERARAMDISLLGF